MEAAQAFSRARDDRQHQGTIGDCQCASFFVKNVVRNPSIIENCHACTAARRALPARFNKEGLRPVAGAEGFRPKRSAAPLTDESCSAGSLSRPIRCETLRGRPGWRQPAVTANTAAESAIVIQRVEWPAD